MPTDDSWSPGPPRRPGRRARTDASEARPPAGRQEGPARVAGQHDPRATPGHPPQPYPTQGRVPQGPPPTGRPPQTPGRPAPPYPGQGAPGPRTPHGGGLYGQPAAPPYPNTPPPGPGYPGPGPGYPNTPPGPTPYPGAVAPSGPTTYPGGPPPGPATYHGAPPGPTPYHGGPPPGPTTYPGGGPPPGPAGPGTYVTGAQPTIFPTGAQRPVSPAPGAPAARLLPDAEGFDTAAFGLDRPATTGTIQTAFEGGPFGSGGTFPAAGGTLDPDDSVKAFAPREPEADQPDAADDHHHLNAFRKIRSHAKQRRVPRWTMIVVVLGLVAVGAGLRFAPGSPFSGGSAGGSAATSLAAMPFHDADITATGIGTEGFLSWAFLDLRDGKITGAANMANTTDSASMIKVWLASDYLRRSSESGTTPSAADLADLELMIRDSDNAVADRIIGGLGGPGETIGRLVATCQLTETRAGEVWGATIISARDAVRMGACLVAGKAAGPQWTQWVLDKMRQVRGEGDFGIRKAFPPAVQPTIAIKNGWALRAEDNAVHVNCLAIGDTWVLSVVQRYPSHGTLGTDMSHVDTVCQDVTRKLMA